ncbi:MFS transporter [Rhodopila sp.]|uniref:MFS transporter n=1 Tax=Rhodopila sp. TaxID=2480087 RepID=UPI003D108C30
MAEALPFAALDEQKFKRFHWLTLFTTGMGVFTDGYDLSSIGIVLPLVLASFGVNHLTGIESGALAGSALVGAALGALIFGPLAQNGRKKFYGYDVMLMAAMAFAQIFAPTLWWLIAIRFVLGIGVGADYVLSPTIMAEHANRPDRGKQIAIGFGVMWQSGAMVAALLSLLLIGLGVSPDLRWRIVLAFGAVPAISVLYLRRKMPETARYLARLADDPAGAARVVEQISGAPAERVAQRDRRPFRRVFAEHARAIFGAALIWMLFDIVIYSGILFGPSLIAHSLGITPAIFALLVSGLFILPAAWLGVLLIDRIGRKPLTMLGFLGSAIALAAFAWLHDAAVAVPALGLLLFGLYNVMIVAGPGTTAGAGILGVEVSPTRIRSIGQAITVVGGRTGASISAFVFPLLFGILGEQGVIWLLAATSLVGAACTIFVIPETARRSLEEINADSDVQVARAGAD